MNEFRLISWGFILFGAVGLWLGWRLLVRYRQEFFRDPPRTMSIEVFARMIGFGGYGYFAALALVIGGACVFLGATALIVEFLSRLRWL